MRLSARVTGLRRMDQRLKGQIERVAKQISVFMAVVFWAVIITVTASNAESSRRVVVELFTSQGCSACPPAEEVLGELAGRDDVLALEFHVDYWDYIGWRDPFAKPEFTDRQRLYQTALNQRFVFTPQVIINGQEHEVGSRRMKVERKINAAAGLRDERFHGPAGPVLMLTSFGETGMIVEVQAGVHKDLFAAGGFDLYFVAFDHAHTTHVTRGENAGKSLTNHNVVRMMRNLGQWNGEPMRMRLELEPEAQAAGGFALLLQDRQSRQIVTNTVLVADAGS